MADHIKEHDNKDQESGRPVQLDREEQGGETGQDKDTQHDKQAGRPAQQQPGHQPQNR
jgi:hypothetical protein